MKLILTRHGETEKNKQNIHQGQLIQGTLSKLGKEQAKSLALRLKNEKIDEIYSSDLARSADTAREIAKFHKNTPINFIKELREQDLGSLSGKDTRKTDWDNLPDDVESRENLTKRCKSILDQAYKKHPNGTVLFVGHGGINADLIALILNEDYKKFVYQKNTAINIFEIKESKNHKIILINCIKHLN